MKIAATGFVSAASGSVASANALLLRDLLERGHEVTFFSKSSFVDPRPVAAGYPNFTFVEVDNRWADRFRRLTQRIPVWSQLTGLLDAWTYNRLLVRRMRAAKADLALWLGDYARGRSGSIPTVSLVQGPPGTDARSVRERFTEIKRLTGAARAWKWRLLARLRLSGIGLPPFRHTDRFIVGGSQSRKTLAERYGIPAARIAALPYQIDLALFRPPSSMADDSEGPLRCLWLGRFVPRKRLDLLLEAAAEAIRGGTDLQLTVVGVSGFVAGYEKLLAEFPFPERLTWIPRVEREAVPALLHRQDVLVQPSEQEDFGSSVAEAQACGLPVIVGPTSGNADYLSERDLLLEDYRVATLAAALEKMALRKKTKSLGDPAVSRRRAEEVFSARRITDAFVKILEEAGQPATAELER